MYRGVLALAVVLAASFGAPEPAAAYEPISAERIVFGRSCDNGPEHPLSFIAADGSGRITRPELGDFIGVRVSPSEYSTSMPGELLVAQTPTASRAWVNVQNGTVMVYDDDPPPVPYSSNSIVARGVVASSTSEMLGLGEPMAAIRRSLCPVQHSSNTRLLRSRGSVDSTGTDAPTTRA